jgi:thiosulfate reductase cytochrome b subunit
MSPTSALQSKHRLAVRWLHWINFPLLFLMMWSGLMIYWANDVYGVGAVHFFPEWLYRLFALRFMLAVGMAMHFFFMWFFAINGIAYVCYLVFSGEWRFLWLDRKSFRDAILVTLHDLHLRKERPPQRKYNAAQKIAYSVVVLMGVARPDLGRLPTSSVGTLLAHARVCGLFRDSCHSGDPGWVEQLPIHGGRV